MVEIRPPISTSEFVHNKIKEWIISGELIPGMKLDQNAIAEKLGVSRMPIRTALEKLSMEDFVDVNSHRGATVKHISADHLEDIYLVRNQLESLAIKIATEIITDKEVDQLYKMIEEQDVLYESSSNVEDILVANRNFHYYLYQITNRPVLLKMIDQLWYQSERYRRILLNQPGMITGSTSEHRQLVMLMSKRNVNEASMYLIEHNNKTKLVVLGVIKKISEKSKDI